MFDRFFALRIPPAVATALRTTLFNNLFDDVWYARFPQIPGSTKERLTRGAFELTHLLDGTRQTLVVRKGTDWMGSLVLLRGETPRFVTVLPQEDQLHLDALVAAALEVAGLDAAERAQPALA